MTKRKRDKNDKKSSKGFLNNFYMLKIIWSICPIRIIASFVNQLLNFGFWVFYSVIFMRYLFGAAEMTKTFAQVSVFIGILVIALLIGVLFDAWYANRLSPMTDQIMHQKLNEILFEKAAKVDISCYETPEFYDSYTKATTEAFTRAVSVVDNMAKVIGALLATVFVSGTILSINPFIALFMLLPITGHFFIGKYVNTLAYAKNQADVPFKRQQDYVNRTIFLQKYTKEIKLTNIFSVLEDRYLSAMNGLIGNVRKYYKKIYIITQIKNTINFQVLFEGVWLFAAFNAMVTKSIKIGDFVVVANAVVSLTWMMIELTDAIVISFNNGLFIINLKEFLNYKEEITENQDGIVINEAIETLELKNVSFKYKGQDAYTLSNINITIRAGERIALVGHNGAGKTTLIKLIMRLYDPTEGEISLNGINIKELNLKEYRKLIGTTFQDFQIMSMSVLENVLMKNIENESEREHGIQALKKSGVYDRIANLENREDSILTREFDDNGVVFSGGEFQKIAIARAFAKNAPIMILDEPSSALDPVAEHEMYETIMELCDESEIKKLSIIISHRLSSAITCHRIYLFEHGSIIEEGTHMELLAIGNGYADMFHKQAESYLVEEEAV